MSSISNLNPTTVFLTSVYLTSTRLQIVKCEEDDEFLAELEKTMTTELAGRKMDNTRVNSSDLALPMNRGFKGGCDRFNIS